MLDTEFMRLAFGAGAVVGVLAPAVGFFLVQRRQSLIGDGIGHVAFAGVAAGILLDVSPVLTALVAAVAGGVAIELLRSRGVAAGDQALALVFYTGIALGVVLVSAAGALDVGLFQYLFGSILTITRTDVAVIATLGAVGLGAIALLYRTLAGVAIDEEGAQVAGVPIGAINVAIGALAAVTVALSMRVVGILLVAALMVLPVSAATRLAWSMRSTFVLSMAIGLGSALVGLTISYYADAPPGGTIVLVAAGAFGLAALPGRSPAGDSAYAATRAASTPTSWQPPQRASYCSAAPTRTVSPEYGAGCPSTSRCVVVAVPPQRWHTAWSLSTNSAWERSSGIGPNGSRRKSWSSPAAMTRTPRSARSRAAATTDSSKNCTSSIPTTSNPDERETSSGTEPTGTARMRMPAWLTTSAAS